MTAGERCLAGDGCADATVQRDDAGEPVARVPGWAECGPLCERDADEVRYAISALPRDLRDLEALLVPSTQQKVRDPDEPTAPRVKKAPPLPLRADVLALMELIVYEATTWANAVARAAGMDAPATLEVDEDGNRIDPRTGEWLPINLVHCRWDARVQLCCDLLEYRLHQLVELPVLEYEAHSLTDDPADGHDHDTARRLGDEVWCYRTGGQGALVLLELHRTAQRQLGLQPGDRLDLPCPRCQARALVREHHNQQVVCRRCKRHTTDDEHDQVVEIAASAHGIPTQPPEPEVVDRRLVPVELIDLRDRWAREAEAAAHAVLAEVTGEGAA